MAVTNFEITSFLPSGTVTGSCEMFEGASAGFPEVPGAATLQPSNNLLQQDQDLIVRINWQVGGPGAFFLLPGNWHLEAFAEQIGAVGVVTPLPPPPIPVGLLPDTRDINFGVLPVGYHRIIVSMQWFQGLLPGPVAGFVDLGIVKVFTSP